MTHRIIEQINN